VVNCCERLTVKHLCTILVYSACICLSAAACSDSTAANEPDDTADTETPQGNSSRDASDASRNDSDVTNASSNDASSGNDASGAGEGSTSVDAAASDTAKSDTDAADTTGGGPNGSEADASGSGADATTPEGGSPLERVELGSAKDYVILAKSAISATGVTSIVGDVGLSPADATYITGFGLSAPPTTYSSSDLVTGKIWAPDYDAPTPVNLTTAVLDMQAAYTDAAGRVLPDATELGAGNIDGMTLSPGLYKWGTGVNVPNNVTLEGASTDVWIFQIGQDLLLGNGASVTLSGQAQPENVFWQVAGQATLGTTSSFQGILLSQTLIEFNTGATMTGRAFAQTAVTLDATVLTAP
jgi:hypothetical protein